MEISSQFFLSSLMNALWQIALLAAAATLGDRLLRGQAARHRHWLWTATLGLSLCLPMLIGAGILNNVIAGIRRQQTMGNQAATIPSQSVQGPSQNSEANAAQPNLSTVQTRSIGAGGFIFINRKVAATLIAIYLLFVFYRGQRLLRAWLRTRAIRRSAQEIALSKELQYAVVRCQNQIRAPRARVLRSDGVTAPVTVGFFYPVILLPEYLWRESDADILTAAVGHELVHILRRDFLLNLFYELIYLPISFHPAAWLVRRQINQTRELGCDELVTEKLLNAQAYARSLVRLAGASIPFNRSTTTISVGVADADILEERVMTILNTSKSTVRRRGWSLIAASLCLAAPCLAAASMALRVRVDRVDPKVPQPTAVSQRDVTEDTQQKEEPVRMVGRLFEFKAAAEHTERWWEERETPTVSSPIAQESLEPIAQEALEQLKRQEEKRQLELKMKEAAERDDLDALKPELLEHRKAEREMMARRQAALAKEAKISMQQAIQIASSQYPGAVLYSRLSREFDQASYVLSILSENGSGSTLTLVVMSAADGSILKIEKEER